MLGLYSLSLLLKPADGQVLSRGRRHRGTYAPRFSAVDRRQHERKKRKKRKTSVSSGLYSNWLCSNSVASSIRWKELTEAALFSGSLLIFFIDLKQVQSEAMCPSYTLHTCRSFLPLVFTQPWMLIFLHYSFLSWWIFFSGWAGRGAGPRRNSSVRFVISCNV